MTPEEITGLVESTAFYQHPEDSNIVYVNLKRLKEALTKKLPLANVSKSVCKHNGRKRPDPLGGFFCAECGCFVNKQTVC